MAIEYLRHTRMTNEDIASRLGYSDAANFRHAFARWTGKSPSEYRRLSSPSEQRPVAALSGKRCIGLNPPMGSSPAGER